MSDIYKQRILARPKGGLFRYHEYRIQNTESLLSTLIVTDHQCYRAIKSLQTTVHSNTIDTYNTRPRKYQCRRYMSQELKPMGAQLSLKAAMPLAENPATSRKTLAIEDPGAHVTNAKRPLTRSPQQKAQLWLADAKASPNHSQAPRQKLPAKTPLALTT